MKTAVKEVVKGDGTGVKKVSGGSINDAYLVKTELQVFS
ncbi:hypothetical protein SAMN05421807_10473 [Virgibacillus chiguensis]|uniref:Uncharacterized protein n=1 Tax=Virgibacillus chiguensis TaxID=411959 RepID=A0A1M5QCK9_9BACI|nr:hypothetical protein SAMN05421807_10473 [Virgibacillus chiguensis]